jgi:hypothetical protein
MSNKPLLFFLLLLNSAANAQPLTTNWMDKKADTFSEFIRKDSQGNIIVVGKVGNYIPVDYVIVYKYNNSGTFLWQKKILSQYNGCQVRAFDVEIDSLDNIYIAGTINFSCTNSEAEGFLRKYNSAGTLLWANVYGGNAGLAIELKAMEIFQNKFIYVAGKSYTIGTGNPEQGFVARYDSSGSQNWTRTLSNNYETTNSVLALDKIGNIYIGGRTTCCLPGYDIFLYKCDSLGNTRWYQTVLDTTIGYAYPTFIAVDDSANVYLTGSGSRIQNFNGVEFVVSKVDSSGNKKWYIIFTDSLNNGFDYPHALAVDKIGNAYLAGTIDASTTVNLNGFAAKISTAGNIIWKDKYEGPAHDDDGFQSGFLVNDTSFIVTGGATFTSTSGGLLIRNYKYNGFIAWTYENVNHCSSTAAVVIDSSIYCTGYFDGTPFGITDSLFTCRLDMSLANGIPKLYRDNTCNAYPNPFSDLITITSELKNSSNKDIFITDILGKKVYEKFGVSLPLTINLNKINAGIYLLQLQDKESIERRKILKY